MKYILLYLFSLLFLSCSHQIKMADRSGGQSSDAATEVSREGSASSAGYSNISENDFNKYAFELGYDPSKGLSETEKTQVRTRYQVRRLERGLDSEKERRHYSKVLPYLVTDQEKIDYLSNPTIEGRQAWVIRNKIWNRAKTDKDFLEVVEAQDLTLGMTQDLVKKSWGEPESVEYSGNPIYKNEKWRYLRDVPSPNGYKRERRYVFFEGGRVVGWETE